jgi:selenoprotein W-related protein
VNATRDLLHDYQHIISDVRVVTGANGVFDVRVDGELLYSKKQIGRHAEPGEVLRLFREHYAAGVDVYER